MRWGKKISPNMPVHPSSLDGVGKTIGELLGRYFVETYRISIFCLRIGSFFRDPPVPRNLQGNILRSWCSLEDLAQLVSRCSETDNLGFQVFYRVSNDKRH
jgi:hypothetical protein